MAGEERRANPGPGLAKPTAPYSFKAPSPPYIDLPRAPVPEEYSFAYVPRFADSDPLRIADDDIRLIINNTVRVHGDAAVKWTYESRRHAQKILDFLYMGPTAVTRDQAWLQETGITMVMTIHDPRFETFARASVDRQVKPLGIETTYIGASKSLEVLPSSETIVGRINDHLIAVFRQQLAEAHNANGTNQTAGFPDGQRRGKVLVTCETGNDRAAVAVAAYIMTSYGVDMPTTVHFISTQRFCVNIDDDARRVLLTLQDMLQARADVKLAQPVQPADAQQAQSRKRDIRDAYADEMEEDTDMQVDETPDLVLDRARYMGRSTFVPFVDAKDASRGCDRRNAM